MHKLKLLILALAGVALFSCEPTYEKEYSWAYPVSGDWKVNVYVGDVMVAGPVEIKSYNSAFGKDSIWIDDYGTSSWNSTDSIWEIANGNFWTMQVKCAVDMKAKTFQTAGSVNAIGGYPIGIKVLNGKVINNDSIYLEVQFGDDGYEDGAGEWVPTPYETTYKLAGHREVSYEDYNQ